MPIPFHCLQLIYKYGGCVREESSKWDTSFLSRLKMASLKAEKPAGSQLFGPAKKEPAKAGDGSAKALSSKSGAKKPAQKSQEPKKKAKGGKSAAKH